MWGSPSQLSRLVRGSVPRLPLAGWLSADVVAVAVGSGIDMVVGTGAAAAESGGGAVVGVSVGRRVAVSVGSRVGPAVAVGSGWLSADVGPPGCEVAVGDTTAVGAGSEQAARATRANRAMNISRTFTEVQCGGLCHETIGERLEGDLRSCWYPALCHWSGAGPTTTLCRWPTTAVSCGPEAVQLPLGRQLGS